MAEQKAPKSGPDKTGLTAFVVRILEQLSLSAWLPAALLTASVALLERFRANQRIDIGKAVADITHDPWAFLVLLLPLLVITTMVTQAFSFVAIRTLEGYWRGRGPAGLLRHLLIRWHLHRKVSLSRRRLKSAELAFARARPQMLRKGQPHSIVNYLEAKALESDLPLVSIEDEAKLKKMNWRSSCEPWRLAKIDSLIREERRYPQKRRVMPTKLGNVLRAAEDSLGVEGEDLQGWVIRRKDTLPVQLQADHDHYRTRLDMYAILVFIGLFMALITPLTLVGHVSNLWSIAVMAGAFLALSIACYYAAIASAEGYGGILKEIKRRSP